MYLIEELNNQYSGAIGRKSLYDIIVPENWNGKLILFVHGYMGFKDWGCWHLVGEFFVARRYAFVRYNVSHNGGTIGNPIDFPDTEAFSRNTYSKELEDFERITETVKKRMNVFNLAISEMYTIGHSRGGGIVALQSIHPMVSKWVSWAGISDIARRFPDGNALVKWQTDTYRYVTNSRTKQELPHHFDQFLDFEKNRDRLNIEKFCRSNSKPCLIIHGREDTSVPISEGEHLASWTGTSLLIIEEAQHTFNATHPWHASEMPEALKKACQQTLLFFET